jgi:hypothetical protein
MEPNQGAGEFLGPRYGVPITDAERKRLLAFRGTAYVLLLLYMACLVINAVLIITASAATAIGWWAVKWPILAAWAGGTTGLGAGSLIFKTVLDYLFGVGLGRSVIKLSGKDAAQRPT